MANPFDNVNQQQQQQQQQQQAPAANSPAGNVYGGAASAAHAEQVAQANKQPQNQNESVEDLALKLTSGTILQNSQNHNNGHAPAVNPQTGKPLTPAEQVENEKFTDDKGNPISHSQHIVNSLSKEYKGELLTEGVDVEKIKTGFMEGDLTSLTDSLNTVAQNTYARAMDSFLKLIPEIVAQTEQSVLAKVNESNSSDGVWNEFLQVHPDYKAVGGKVKDSLLEAIANGTPKEQAFAAVDLIFGNLKKKKATPEGNENLFDTNGSRFNLGGIM